MRPGQLFPASQARCPRCNRKVGRLRAAQGWIVTRCERNGCLQPVFLFCALGVCGVYPITADEFGRLRDDPRDAADIMTELEILEATRVA